MPILTSILLFLSGLALIIVLLRTRPKTRARRLEDWEERKMELGALICEAAARDSFEIELDHSEESLVVLDRMIADGWSETLAEHTPDDQHVPVFGDEEEQAVETPHPLHPSRDALFVLGSYLGQVLVTHHGGEWRIDHKTHRWPFVFFRVADLAASPFDILERKLAEPQEFSLPLALGRLREEIERRKNLRVTTWHRSEEIDATFVRDGSQPASLTPIHSHSHDATRNSTHDATHNSTHDVIGRDPLAATPLDSHPSAEPNAKSMDVSAVKSMDVSARKSGDASPNAPVAQDVKPPQPLEGSLETDGPAAH